ncbi:MAG TPA: YifB family Mg chelatase-like AAA ATPase [Actinomycetota bacterium]|nr:YifB family Mg chelatase-like AAA ATPase [Actinomycetota bacterium]
MLAKTESVALIGTEARLVDVEVHVATGLPAFRLVGLPAKSVTEAGQRVRSGLISSDERWPPARITANLAPGALRKEGAHFDLAIALGVVAADKRLDPKVLTDWLIVGEVGLDGGVRAIRGTLAAAFACKKSGRRGLVCPASNAAEAAIVDDIEVVGVSSVSEAISFFKGRWQPEPVVPEPPDPVTFENCLSEVRGHPAAKRALEIAAAGSHNLLLIGPPGSGKTMLSHRMPSILPEMSLDESIEVTKVYSVAGLLAEKAGLIRKRTLRAPHHHISMSGLIGGGPGLARPGEVSLAHHGVLFLDEIALFRSDVLESLRGPLEDGLVRIARSAGVVEYPARFSLIAAMNPCPCGFIDDPVRDCSCTHSQLHRYGARLSGPLLDRFDMECVMTPLSRAELLGAPRGETSAEVRERVARARLIQAQRYGPLHTNASCSKRQLDRWLSLSPTALAAIGDAMEGMLLTGRGVVRAMRVARTIADLAGTSEITAEQMGEALNFRRHNLDREAA